MWQRKEEVNGGLVTLFSPSALSEMYFICSYMVNSSDFSTTEGSKKELAEVMKKGRGRVWGTIG